MGKKEGNNKDKAQINDIENHRDNQCNKKTILWKKKQIYKFLSIVTKITREKTQIINNRNGTGDITIDLTSKSLKGYSQNTNNNFRLINSTT